jgi:hypothetical protein
LPQGWEEKYDAVNKRVFYVDHNTKTTTWTRPATAPSATPADVQQQQQQEGSPAAAAAGSSASGQQAAGWSSSGSLARKSRPGSSGKGGGEDGGDDSDSGVSAGGTNACRVKNVGSLGRTIYLGPRLSSNGNAIESAKFIAAPPHETAALLRLLHRPAEKAMYEPLTPWCMFSPRLAKVSRLHGMAVAQCHGLPSCIWHGWEPCCGCVPWRSVTGSHVVCI